MLWHWFDKKPHCHLVPPSRWWRPLWAACGSRQTMRNALVHRYITMAGTCPPPHKSAPSHGGIWTPSNTWFSASTRVSLPKRYLDQFSRFHIFTSMHCIQATWPKNETSKCCCGTEECMEKWLTVQWIQSHWVHRQIPPVALESVILQLTAGRSQHTATSHPQCTY